MKKLTRSCASPFTIWMSGVANGAAPAWIAASFMPMVDVALTIAGSDPSGGAGIQADLKTFHQHGVYGAAAITLLTVQSTRGVSHVEVMPAALVRDQARAVIDDVPPGAVKTGALGSAEVVRAVAELAAELACPLVVDPVMISKHGAPLLDDDAARALAEALLPHAFLVTPNAPEARALSGVEVTDRASALEAARVLATRGPRAVLIKGGHLAGPDATDFLFVDGELHDIAGPRVASTSTHGTGCTYSAAITARLARGEALVPAVTAAKRWLTDAIRSAPGLGSGIGPLNHLWPVEPARNAR